MLITLLVFLAVLGLLVFVHELGHFLAAKLSGVPVEEFAFGFKPRLISWQWRGTRYAINLIPLGGYVRLLGESEAPGTVATEKQKKQGAYFAQPIGKRLIILLAGSVMNFLLSWALFTIILGHGVEMSLLNFAGNPFLQDNTHLTVAGAVAGSPAELADLQENDQIISINNLAVSNGADFLQEIKNNTGQEVTLTIVRQGEIKEVRLLARANPPEGEGALGLLFTVSGKVKSSWWQAPLAAIYATGQTWVLSAKTFVSFLAGLLVHQEVSDQVTGLVGMGQLTGMARRLGIDYLAQLVAIISAGLAAINLMPIVPMDGGHIALLAYEKIAKRQPSEKQLAVVNYFGLALILIIFVSVTYKDIMRFDVIGRILNR